jgi:hypothetical protein
MQDVRTVRYGTVRYEQRNDAAKDVNATFQVAGGAQHWQPLITKFNALKLIL